MPVIMVRQFVTSLFQGELPYIKQKQVCAALKGLVFVVLQSENRYRLCPFWSRNSGFEGTTGVVKVFVVSIPKELERKSIMKI